MARWLEEMARLYTIEVNNTKLQIPYHAQFVSYVEPRKGNKVTLVAQLRGLLYSILPMFRNEAAAT